MPSPESVTRRRSPSCARLRGFRRSARVPRRSAGGRPPAPGPPWRGCWRDRARARRGTGRRHYARAGWPVRHAAVPPRPARAVRAAAVRKSAARAAVVPEARFPPATPRLAAPVRRVSAAAGGASCGNRRRSVGNRARHAQGSATLFGGGRLLGWRRRGFGNRRGRDVGAASSRRDFRLQPPRPVRAAGATNYLGGGRRAIG